MCLFSRQFCFFYRKHKRFGILFTNNEHKLRYTQYLNTPTEITIVVIKMIVENHADSINALDNTRANLLKVVKFYMSNKTKVIVTTKEIYWYSTKLAEIKPGLFQCHRSFWPNHATSMWNHLTEIIERLRANGVEIKCGRWGGIKKLMGKRYSEEYYECGNATLMVSFMKTRSGCPMLDDDPDELINQENYSSLDISDFM